MTDIALGIVLAGLVLVTAWVAVAYIDYRRRKSFDGVAQFLLDSRRVVQLEAALCESQRAALAHSLGEIDATELRERLVQIHAEAFPECTTKS